MSQTDSVDLAESVGSVVSVGLVVYVSEGYQGQEYVLMMTSGLAAKRVRDRSYSKRWRWRKAVEWDYWI